jgi:Short C-terminal domain
MRAAVVGGGAYVAGKHVANKQAQKQDQAYQEGQADASQQQAPQQQQYATQPAPQAATPAGGGMADELAKLKSLLDSGALTPDEYEAAKQKVIQG